MWNHPPQLPYKGLTIVMSQASRFDTSKLLSGNGGTWFTDEVLRPGLTRFHCHIMDCDAFNASNRRLMEGTKVVLCLGSRAQKEVMQVDTTLNEQRGSPLVRGDGLIYISTYLPQDAYDPRNFEATHNPLLAGEDDSDDYETDDADEKSRKGNTSRKNYRFWILRDVNKIKGILVNGGLNLPPESPVRIYESAKEIVDHLRSAQGTTLHLDIETDSQRNMLCFGYSFGDTSGQPVYVVPTIRYNYVPAYSSLGSIIRSLAFAIWNNTVVAHNGAGFDFLVLCYKYRIPVPKTLYDTMIAHHRCFPEVEKSLGHGISNFTNLPYHKDEGVFEPKSEEQEWKLWNYNGKDVSSMRELKRGIDAYAAGVPGLTQSIAQANNSIYPYLITTLQGIRYKDDEMAALVALNDRKMTQLLRIIRVAMGENIAKYVRGSGKDGFPSSSTQCVRYFHDVCRYPVVGYGKESKKDGKRKPSLDEKNFYKLVMKGIDNPIIDLVLEYRRLGKESGSLKFNPWGGVEK